MEISRCKVAVYMRVATEEQIDSPCDTVYRAEPALVTDCKKPLVQQNQDRL